jgi:hypothetical protein
MFFSSIFSPCLLRHGWIADSILRYISWKAPRQIWRALPSGTRHGPCVELKKNEIPVLHIPSTTEPKEQEQVRVKSSLVLSTWSIAVTQGEGYAMFCFLKGQGRT